MMIFFITFIFFSSMILLMIDKKYFWLSVGIFFISFVIVLLQNMNFLDLFFLSGSFACDMISYSLIVLSIWVSLLMLMSSKGIYMMNFNLFMFFCSVIILFLTLVMTFSVVNLLMFYFFFEFSLIPTLMIIGGWGYQPERIQAGIYFLFYTLTASLPLLVGLIFLSKIKGSLNFFIFFLQGVNSLEGLMVFLVFMTAFLVKMPMFFVHLWLPKAHVEAPVSGSMILAGVLLKLGGYGFYRIMPLLMKSIKIYGTYFFGLSILGMFYVGLMCCRLNDLKALVAYSSVAHMGLVICGILSYYFWGLTGGLMMMLAHGLASSGLFCFVNIFYERTGSRSFYLNKGLIMYLPLYTFLFFMFCISNMAAPPTLNLASEIFLMGSMMKFSYLMVIFFPLGSYLGAVFTLFLFSYSQHGRSYFTLNSMELSVKREFHLFYLHLLPVNYLFLNLDYFVYTL